MLLRGTATKEGDTRHFPESRTTFRHRRKGQTQRGRRQVSTQRQSGLLQCRKAGGKGQDVTAWLETVERKGKVTTNRSRRCARLFGTYIWRGRIMKKTRVARYEFLEKKVEKEVEGRKRTDCHCKGGLTEERRKKK